MREFIYDFKKNKIILFFKMLLLVFFSLILILCFSFGKSTNASIDSNFSSNQGKNLYTITDSIVQPDDFEKFRSSEKSIDTVAHFYNGLNKSDKFEFLSVFDQSVYVSDFRGKKDFLEDDTYSSEDNQKTVSTVKSIQMNKNSYEFYRLKLQKGAGIKWEDVNMTAEGSNSIPIVLGNDYTDYYNLNDILQGEFYFKQFNFKVVGFLEENSSIFYKENQNFFLDDSILIPYPYELPATKQTNKEFLGILSFAMMSGDIAIDKESNTEELLYDLDQISEESQFYQYSIVQFPDYLIQFKLMRKILVSNILLIIIIAGIIGIALVFLVFYMNKILFQSRYHKLHYLFIKGESANTIYKTFIFTIIPEYLLIYFSTLVLNYLLLYQVSDAILLILLVQTIYFIIEILVMLTWLDKHLDKEVSN